MIELGVLIIFKIIVFTLAKAFKVYLQRSMGPKRPIQSVSDHSTELKEQETEKVKNEKNAKIENFEGKKRSKIINFCGSLITRLDDKMDYEMYWAVYTAM